MQRVLLRALVFSVISSFAFSAHSQSIEIDCGEVDEIQCVMLENTLDRWNAHFGERFRAIAVQYMGNAGSEAVSELYGLQSNSPVLSLDEETGDLVLKSVSDVFGDGATRELGESVAARLRTFNGRFQHVVEITWVFEGREIESRALLGEQYPYILDTIIASVLIAVAPTSNVEDAILCAFEEFRFFSFVKMAEYEARFYSTQTRSVHGREEFTCELQQDGWSYLGQLRYIEAPISYTHGRCSTLATVEYQYPFSSITVEYDGIGLGVERVTGGERRTSRCELP